MRDCHECTATFNIFDTVNILSLSIKYTRYVSNFTCYYNFFLIIIFYAS